jgi:hypothetical protein
MLFYRQFRKKLAQTAKKLVLKLVEIVYNTAIQLFTPPHPPPQKNKKPNEEYLIVCCFIFKNCQHG